MIKVLRYFYILNKFFSRIISKKIVTKLASKKKKKFISLNKFFYYTNKLIFNRIFNNVKINKFYNKNNLLILKNKNFSRLIYNFRNFILNNNNKSIFFFILILMWVTNTPNINTNITKFFNTKFSTLMCIFLIFLYNDKFNYHMYILLIIKTIVNKKERYR